MSATNPSPRPQFKVHVSVVVTDTAGRFLLVQEAKPECRGQWNLPGGHLDHGESPVVGAARELREETGLDLQMECLLGIYPRGESIRFVFVAKCEGREAAAGDEILAVQWWKREQILAAVDSELTAPANLRQIVRELDDGRSFPLSVVRPMTR